MKIGVDLRALQIGHEYRGIGEVVRRTLNTIFSLAEQDKTGTYEFIFFEYKDKDPKKYLNIPRGLKYKEIFLGKQPKKDTSRETSDKFNYKLRTLFGDPVPQAADCDVFLQYDYSLGVPKHTKSLVFANDLIPLIYWRHNFTSPWLHIKHRALRSTLRTILHNYEYKHVLKRSYKNATKVISISEYTKADLVKHLHINPKKIKTILLGISPLPLDDKAHEAKSETKTPTKPYLLFIGAADPRRRAVNDLIAAFNNLKAEGRDLQLVLVGENFQSAENIPTLVVRQAVTASSYKNDILTLGYINDETKHKLYQNALAFVFPSHYEGFGLPILEGMLYGCPVITYKNSSIPEVGGEQAIYVKNWQGIWEAVRKLMDYSPDERKTLIDAGKKHAASFNWDKTAEELFTELKSLAGNS